MPVSLQLKTVDRKEKITHRKIWHTTL